MERLNIVEYTDRWTAGGCEKYIANLTGGLDKRLFSIKVWTAQKESNLYDPILVESKTKMEVLLPKVYSNPILRIMNTWNRFYKCALKEQPDIIHIHICQAVGFVYAFLAKRAGIKCVITHSHSSNCGSKNRKIKLLGHRMSRFLFQKNVDVKLACSDLAGEWLYGKGEKFKIVNIPVDIEHFRFDESKRKQMRLEHQVEGEYVILNIGRMDEIKNQLYLIDVFWELQKKCKAKLYIIGQGENRKNIVDRIHQYCLEDKVKIISQTLDVDCYMCMADVFVLTSIYEGNPVVLVEAQTSGLACVYSDCITSMAKINENVEMVSLEESKQKWSDKIMEVLNTEMERGKGYQNVKKHGYDVENIIDEMQCIYKSMGTPCDR